jgi:hypothetical protein
VVEKNINHRARYLSAMATSKNGGFEQTMAVTAERYTVADAFLEALADVRRSFYSA